MDTINLKALFEVKEWSAHNFVVVRQPNEHIVSASIFPKTWETQLIIDPDSEQKCKNIGLHKKNLEHIIYALAEHEIGHWEHCPFDAEYYEEILSGTSLGLNDAGITPTQQLCLTAANIFCDIVVNVLNAHDGINPEETKEGLGLFYFKEGALNQKYSQVYSAFVDVQCQLGLDNYDLEEFYTPETQKLSDRCRKIMVGRRTQSKTIVKELRKKEKWHKKARQLTDILGPYLEDMHEEIPSINIDSQDIIASSVRKGRVKNERGYIPSLQWLDELYTQRAENIKIILPEKNNPITRFPVVYCQQKEWDKKSIRHVDWSAPYVFNNKMIFFEDHIPIHHAGEQEPAPSSLHDLCFIIDSSGSMKWNPEAGTGAYDILLRTIYSVFHFLESKNKAHVLSYSALNFSEKSLWSGWKQHSQINEVKKIIFAYQGSVTKLDPFVFQDIHTTARDKFYALMITDGYIENEDAVAKQISNMIHQGNMFSLVQIGRATSFSRNIKNKGADVHVIPSAEVLPQLVLGKIEKAYN